MKTTGTTRADAEYQTLLLAASEAFKLIEKKKRGVRGAAAQLREVESRYFEVS